MSTGSACKLYFDLEFHRHDNVTAEGPTMVETFIKVKQPTSSLCCFFKYISLKIIKTAVWMFIIFAFGVSIEIDLK